jgi:hypothetical protein
VQVKVAGKKMYVQRASGKDAQAAMLKHQQSKHVLDGPVYNFDPSLRDMAGRGSRLHMLGSPEFIGS